jgi:Uncharacterized protein conserved in bacteria
MKEFRECNQTDAEKLLAANFQRKKLIFKQNQIIDGYEVDFWFPDSRLAVEVDGFIHLSAEQKRRDQKKDQTLMDKGIIVIRISNQQIHENLNHCLGQIDEALRHLMEFRKSNSAINDEWKKQLAKIKIVESKPIQKNQTIEEYFLALDDKTE